MPKLIIACVTSKQTKNNIKKQQKKHYSVKLLRLCKLLRHRCKIQRFSRLKDNFKSSCKLFHKQHSWEKCCVCGMIRNFFQNPSCHRHYVKTWKTPPHWVLHCSFYSSLVANIKKAIVLLWWPELPLRWAHYILAE